MGVMSRLEASVGLAAHQAGGTAFEARCLARATRVASIGTQHEGQPHVSLITPAVAADGTVLMLLSEMADHTRHLRADPRCALLFAGRPENLNPQTAPRLTVLGIAEPAADPAHRRHWLSRHPYAALYVDFADFTMWRMAPDAAHYVAGFGRAFRLTGADLAVVPAAAAALVAAEVRLVAQCNGAHADAVSRLAHRHGQHGRWIVLGCDGDGLDLAQDEAVLRVAFPSPVGSAEQAAAALASLFGVPHL